jgi:nicotinate dehydrogenase subunit B
MTAATMTDMPARDLTRRSVLQGAGALIVNIAAPMTMAEAATAATSTKPPLTPDQLDSFIAVHPDGSATAFFGKMDMGQGTDLGIAQIVAEELDLPLERVAVVMGDTARTVNQGGASGSTGIWRGGVALRNAAAEARRLLVERASTQLGEPASQLSVSDGVVSVDGNAAKRVSYGQLIGTGYFNAKLDWNGQLGNPLEVKGQAAVKSSADYKIVGKPYPRRDIAPKAFARFTYVTDVKVPGMLHGRMIRPPVAGAVPVAIDEGSLKDIPGARIVHKDGFLGVVAGKEWNAIRAAQKLNVTWSQVAPAFPDPAALYDHIRQAPVRHRQVEIEKGAVEPALSGAAKVVTAEYEWPFQSHASMGPACAVVAIKDGKVTVWTGSQKPHYTQEGVAGILNVPMENVHAIWVPGPGSYGRNDAGDAAVDAALLAQAVGRPVRVQGMRHEGHGWDPKAPASVHRVRAGLDAAGKIVAYHFESKAFSKWEIETTERSPSHSLAGQLMGMTLTPLDSFGVPSEAYDIPNRLMAWETIPPLLDRASPLRTSHMRDPAGPQMHFASESFVDELALATNTDPVEFRLRHLTGARDIAVIKAAAERAGWETRVAGPRGNGDIVSGRGFAYVGRNGTLVAEVAEIEIDRRTGKVRIKRVVVAHDCGLIINPQQLTRTIEGNVCQATSRSLWEEVRFDREKVTSVDWQTYPILDITEAPPQVDIVLLNHRELPATGAGEASTRPIAAAIANAIFDATGVRLRRAPFRPEHVKGALA